MRPGSVLKIRCSRSGATETCNSPEWSGLLRVSFYGIRPCGLGLGFGAFDTHTWTSLGVRVSGSGFGVSGFRIPQGSVVAWVFGLGVFLPLWRLWLRLKGHPNP